MVFAAPFLPLSGTARAAFGVAVVPVGELMFWIGAVILGPAMAARLRTPKVNTGRSYARRTVAVVGATGGLGKSIVNALLREGAQVLALGRDAGRLAQLPQSDRLRTASMDHSAVVLPLSSKFVKQTSSGVEFSAEREGSPVAFAKSMTMQRGIKRDLDEYLYQ
jgi:hypothetical protein